MSFGSALLSGDECYSRGQFDEAIQWYTQAANQGYVEGMEKLLKTCVEQGRQDKNMVEKKGLHYWGMASSTLRGIMTHAEISKEVKNRSYQYYDEIMYGLALACMWAEKYKEAERAWEKVSRHETIAMKILKAHCDYQVCLEYARELKNSALEKVNKSPEEKAKVILPIPTSIDIDMDEFSENDHDQIFLESSGGVEILALIMALYDFMIYYFIGIVENMALAEPDKDKAFKCWKMIKCLDSKGIAPIPEVIEKDFQERLKEEKFGSKEASKKQPKTQPGTASQPKPAKVTPATRTIVINRPKAWGGKRLAWEVKVDEITRGTVKNGEAFEIDVDCDKHVVEVIVPVLPTQVVSNPILIPADSMDYQLNIKLQQLNTVAILTITGKKTHSTSRDYIAVTANENANLADQGLEEKVIWMKASQGVADFVWFIEQLFIPEAMHGIGEKALVEKYDKVWIRSVGFEKLTLCGISWNEQTGGDSYTDIPVHYKDNNFKLKNANEIKYLEKLIRERVGSLPHIGVKGIYYFLK